MSILLLLFEKYYINGLLATINNKNISLHKA